MYLSSLEIENFRCVGAGADKMVVEFQDGLTAIVGANDAGKTAVIDALRFALGTSDQERTSVEDTDFHTGSREIRVSCKFEKLSLDDQAAFAEFLTHSTDPTVAPILFVNWTVENTGQGRAGRPYYRIETRSGQNGDGPHIPREIRFLLNATYLRPLRDAEDALSAGRYSRLSQVLKQSKLFANGTHACDFEQKLSDQTLSLLGIAELFTRLLTDQSGVAETRERINATLKHVSLSTDSLTSKISVNGANISDDAKVRELLEKLDLTLGDYGKMGLGSDNILFMACELLLLGSDKVGNRMLLIEEPEAHLHAQRQLQLVRSLQEKAKADGIQIILTTHSPNLSSVIELNNLVIIRNQKAYPLSAGSTKLEGTDRSFLQRFLDATKANLFFACGVVIVEGDAENILLPTLARLLKRDFTSHGVSIINVGGVGLGRYSRIFQRTNTAASGELGIPVACMTDLDVMPNCAPEILKKWDPAVDQWPPIAGGRKWRAKRDYATAADLETYRLDKGGRFDGQGVRAFVSDEWSLEYNIASGNSDQESPLAELMWIAMSLAKKDEAICRGRNFMDEEIVSAKAAFVNLKNDISEPAGTERNEKLCSKIYARFVLEKISKPITAQYFAELLETECKSGNLSQTDLRTHLPKYLLDAIEHVTPHVVTEPVQENARVVGLATLLAAAEVAGEVAGEVIPAVEVEEPTSPPSV